MNNAAFDAALRAIPASKWSDMAQDAHVRLRDALSLDVARHMAEMFLGRPLPGNVLRSPISWDGVTLTIPVCADAVREYTGWTSFERFGYAGTWRYVTERRLYASDGVVLTYARVS